MPLSFAVAHHQRNQPHKEIHQMYDDPRHRNTNETKLRLDDAYEAFLRDLARIHRTQKGVIVRAVMKEWIDEMRAQLTANTDAA